MTDDVIIQDAPKDSVTFDPFDGSDKPIEVIKKDEPIIDKKPDDVIDKKPDEIITEEEIFDEDVFLKKEYGWENREVGKKELELLRERAKELDLTNDESKKVFGYVRDGKFKELNKFFNEQEQLEKLVTSDLSDKKIATELVKFGISNKNKDLTQDEVDFLFNERFSKPEKPVKEELEEEADYDQRVEVWRNQVNNIDKRLVIEAKLAKPELEKLKTELKLPDILKAEPEQKQLSPEELAEMQKGMELFIQDADTGLKKFGGFSVAYKDNDVDVQSTYNLSNEERESVLNNVKLFAQNGFDANAIFTKRWVKDGAFDYNQFEKDLAALDTEEKRSQKFVSDTAAKVKVQYMKQKKNIDLNTSNGSGDLQLEDKDFQKKNEDAIWN